MRLLNLHPACRQGEPSGTNVIGECQDVENLQKWSAELPPELHDTTYLQTVRQQANTYPQPHPYPQTHPHTNIHTIGEINTR